MKANSEQSHKKAAPARKTSKAAGSPKKSHTVRWVVLSLVAAVLAGAAVWAYNAAFHG